MGLGSFFNDGQKPQVVPSVVHDSVSGKLKQQIQQELAVANATQLVDNVSQNCFDKCLTVPYSNNNDSCIDQCLQKYLRSWNVISSTYVARIQQASSSGEI